MFSSVAVKFIKQMKVYIHVLIKYSRTDYEMNQAPAINSH